jgi:hypothetical protein
MNEGLKNILIELQLLQNDAVFFTDEKDGKAFYGFSPEIASKIKSIAPNAYYVYNKIPFILFFDLTKSTQERENEIHKKVWSFDNSPVIFIIKNKEIHVYNALNYIKNKNSLEEISFSEKQRKEQFSFWNLQSSFTWKWFQDEYLGDYRKQKTKNRVNEKLFQNIKDVRQQLTEKGLTEQFANSLILRLIFVRYLIDREVEIKKEFISGVTKDERRKCFCELIMQPEKLNQLFEYLNDRFNGVLFKEVDIVINQEQSEFLANVFSGELQGKDSLFNGYFFEIFDFSIIPVEMISGIYESLIDEETKKLDSAVYTPSFLVDYILTDTVDEYLKNAKTSDCKVFDVAVGSGIFLVQSLRRMIEKEIELNGKSGSKTFSKKIRAIAKNNLFGIDKNEEALKVTCFSIYIALLDYQVPKDINKYKFPALFNKENLFESNLFQANFFDTEHPYNKVIKEKKPDFILGNPPWKKDNSAEHLKWLNNKNIYGKKVKGAMEIAQSFLLRAKDFMQLDTRAALIVTSTIFYNVSSTIRIFKNKFLTNYCLDKFFDLSPVRHLIFEKKDNPASIVYFRLSNSDEYEKNIVNHLSIKVNYFLKYFKMLVVEKFDQKEILQKHFIENNWLFKAALYGNVLDYNLLKKIRFNKTILNDYIDNQTIFCGDGVLKGTPKTKPFSFLIGMSIVENEKIGLYYTQVNKNKVLSDETVHLESGRRKELFIGEHIYLKMQTLNESEIVVSYSTADAVHKHDVNAITSEKATDSLKMLYSILLSDIHTYFQFLSTSAWGVATRPAIRLKEYLSFPIIKPDEKTKNKLISLVNQFLKPFEAYYKRDIRSENLPINKDILLNINNIINDLYGIGGYEKDLIDYVLNVSRYQFQESKQHLLDFTDEKNHYLNRFFVLEKYAEVYLQEFGKIYTDEFIQVEIYPLRHFIAMNFVFSNTKPAKQIIYPDKKGESEVLQRLANNLSVSQITDTVDPTRNLFIQKDIKGFEANSFYIIKPNEYKCWHRAMAWYDVAEFKDAIQKAELKRLNIKITND